MVKARPLKELQSRAEKLLRMLRLKGNSGKPVAGLTDEVAVFRL